MAVSGTQKPWLLDNVHVIYSNGAFRAVPATKVVQPQQDVTWVVNGKVLELPQQSGLDNYRYNDDHSAVTATVTASEGSYFEYALKCNGEMVEGNSPPVIIVDGS